MSQSSLIEDGQMALDSQHPVHKSLSSAANLANVLPTGTVLAFNALIPSFSNNGSCQVSHKFLTSSVIIVSAMFCFLSSFTDSIVDSDGKLYYGIATFRGLYIFNYGNWENNAQLVKFKIRAIDFVHAFMSVLVFFAFAISDSNVQRCLVPKEGVNESALIMNLPLGAGVLSSFLFTIFPTTRRGIGCADMGNMI
ncbi:hypothetical protein L6164_035086 [Bauhinia variegata]|uniref:Uncharacterized protein n=1 Tax=Bauhinia variegata TaxID=167791 RepID=A0ACB9KXD7_BAUVA|nr:hypothetical protein L6164_035086 [Bauhinia variegata]